MEWFAQFLVSGSLWFLGLVKGAVTLVFDIAEIDFFNDTSISDLSNRVYMILGVLMLFKITMSCIQYLINPEKSDDKENGFGAIIKRTLISLVLIVFVPTIFSNAKLIQNDISEFLPKIILGMNENANSSRDEMGEALAYTTLLGFFNYSSPSCNDNSIAGLPSRDDKNVIVEPSGTVKFSSIDTAIENINVIVSAKCSATNSKRYSFNYLAILAAIFLIFVFYSMAFDVAIRTIKLGILQIISPIPIASYIDPKSSKKTFDSWVNQCLVVYADLFIRLVTIYFSLYVFRLITRNEIVYPEDWAWDRVMSINVAILIAVFLFAKQAPKYICDILGIKSDGNIGDMFKRPFGVKQRGVVGAVYGAGRTAHSNYIAQKERFTSKNSKAPRLRAAVSAFSGAGSALGRGLKTAVWNKKGAIETSRSSFESAVKERDLRSDRVDNLYSNEPGREYKHSNYHEDVKRAKLRIPSSDSFIKARYDDFVEVNGHSQKWKKISSDKSYKTSDLFKIELDKSNEAEKVVSDILATDRLSLQEATSFLKMIESNGGKIISNKGTTVQIPLHKMGAFGQTLENVKQRAQYFNAAYLASKGDADVLPEIQQMMYRIKNSPQNYDDPSVINPIIEKINDYNNMYKNVKDFTMLSVSDSESLLKAFKSLLENDLNPPTKPSNYDSDSAAKDAYDDAFIAWNSKVKQRADLSYALINGMNDIITLETINAQIADERDKKAQRAIQNSNDRKS